MSEPLEIRAARALQRVATEPQVRDAEALVSRDALALHQQPPELDAPATFKGPLLREILGHVEAAKVKISFTAVNGYTGWLTPEDIDSSDWIVALEVNGQPLGIGQQGPLWLINTRAPDFKPDEADPQDKLVNRILVYGETIGTLTKNGLLDTALVRDWLWVEGIWAKVSAAAEKIRAEAGEPRLYENFEALATG